MKQVWIPGLFVICGAFASVAWRTVELPCQSCKLEIASAVGSPILRCLANELFTREPAFSEWTRAGEVAEELYPAREAAPAVLLRILADHACDRFGGEINSLGVSISSWLVRHRV